MAEQSDVVDRADTLMRLGESTLGGRRRRSFVATPTTKGVAANRRTPVSDDDDLPVLTEVVSAEAAVSEGSPDRFDETQVLILASDIAYAISQQLTEEMPTLLETALLNAGEELRAGISATMETALRDFIARRKQLHLPLDDPNRDR